MNPIQTFSNLGGMGLTCPDSIPTVLGLLDPSIAPPFLYYSYIPIIIIALLFGSFVLIVSREALAGRLLLWIAIVFSLLLSSEIFLWIAVSAPLVHFVWQIVIIFHAILAFLLVYFTYTFIIGENMPDRWQWSILLLLLPVFILAPTTLNLSAFDLANCESVQGPLWLYMYAIEIGALITALFLCVRKSRQTKDQQEHKKALTLGVGVIVFFGIYILSNVLGDVTLIYNINLVGPIGMVAFLGTIAFLIVRYHAFNMRVLGAQALIGTLTAIVFAALFVRKIEDVRYVLVGSLILVVSVGVSLIRGVKREIKQREEIEKIARELKIANEMQADTTSLITHQIRGVFTNTKSGLSNIIEGSYGPVPPELMNIMDLMFKSQVEGVKEVETFLQAQKVESGTIQYEKKPFDLKAVVEDKFAQEKPRTDTKGLQYELQIDAGDYMITGDQVYLTQVIANLIDNAIRYTEKGSIKVQLSRKDSSVLYSVKDSGIGIPDEDKDKMFTKYGHGKDSRKTNADTAGLGLYIVHGIVAGHGGKIWYETKVGEGTTFFVELPIDQTSK